MNDNNYEISEELLQRYYDGELDSDEARRRVEQAIERDSALSGALDEFRAVSALLTEAADRYEPDQLSSRRTWDAIDTALQRGSARGRMRRHGPWLGALAAAAAIVLYLSPLNIVGTAQANNELEIESIDCNYASFMVLQPEEQDGHTIIWINDPGAE